MSRSHRVGTTGNLQHSMRANYGEHGVDKYYKQVGATYRNPHFPGVRACMSTWMDRWWTHEKDIVGSRSPLILDMACGSGEVTVAVYEWWKGGGSKPQSKKRGLTYLLAQDRDEVPSKSLQDGGGIEPSAPAAGQVPQDLRLMATDPYTEEAYVQRTSLPCAPLSFRDVSEGLLPPKVSTASSIGQTTDTRPTEAACVSVESAEAACVSTGSAEAASVSAESAEAGVSAESLATAMEIDMVICSFALHLIESASELFALLWELSTKARWLVVLAPHKKPEVHSFISLTSFCPDSIQIKDGWGWEKWDCESWSECSMSDRRGEDIQERVHCRAYRSINIAAT
ncbi:hypothetical protein HYDPIDRAFT_118440 [Hydnomerulius pinastri MD-312]|uniref:Uncharacterized protein n=1 Tax=Hydnomerulius pinastri MD-312 TaxID=994086 RepID=A0A0C9V2H8_9AGAM|nr:hypothetical protein HYDPIDRAFT_118440 [Hydnomerulius pinastri MD-312]